jgi:hypothetical protein
MNNELNRVTSSEGVDRGLHDAVVDYFGVDPAQHVLLEARREGPELLHSLFVLCNLHPADELECFRVMVNLSGETESMSILLLGLQGLTGSQR